MLNITTTQGITTLLLARPEKHNAFGPELIQAITEALEKLADDGQTRVLIISGAGRSFSAGADLKHMKSMVDFSEEENIADARELARMLETLNHFPRPVISAVNGYAIAGATGLIATSDVVIAASDARFSISEVKLGIAPAVISPYVITRIGIHQARRYFLTAERFDAEAAREAGLVHEIVPPDALMTRARDIASGLLENGPLAMAATKALIHRVAPTPVDEGMSDYTCELIAKLRASEEGQQGLSAFFSKTAPPWVPEVSHRPPPTGKGES